MAVNNIGASNWLDKYKVQLPQMNKNSGGGVNANSAVSSNQNLVQSIESNSRTSWLDKYRNGEWQNNIPDVQMPASPLAENTTYKEHRENSALTNALPFVRTDRDIQADIDKANGDISQLEKQVASYKGQLEEAQGNLQLHAGYDDEADYKAKLDKLTSESNYYNQKLAEAKNSLNEYNAELGYYTYGRLKNKSDFKVNSQYDTNTTGNDKANTVYQSNKFNDLVYHAINGNSEARAELDRINTTTNANFLGYGAEFLYQMTDDEVSTFNYIYKKQGAEAAYEYIDYIQSDLYAKQREYETQKAAEYAEEHPIKASLFSVATSPLKSLSYLGQAADYAANGQIDQNAGYNKFSYANSAMRGAVAQKIEDSGKWGKVGSFLYQTGLSMGDFLLNSGITGGSEALSLALMGTGAAADSVIDAKDRGLSDDQSFLLGTIAGAAEIITEKVSIEALFDSDLTGVKYLLKNIFSEGSEEVGSDLINLIADGLIAGNQSQLKASIRLYELQGMSESEAFVETLKDKAVEIGLDFLGGAISGGVMAIPGTVMTWNDTKTNAQTDTKQNMDISPIEALLPTQKAPLYTQDELIDMVLSSGKTANEQNNTASTRETEYITKGTTSEVSAENTTNTRTSKTSEPVPFLNTPLDGGGRAQSADTTSVSSGVLSDAALGGEGHTPNGSSSSGASSATSFSNTNISRTDTGVKNDSSTSNTQNVSENVPLEQRRTAFYNRAAQYAQMNEQYNKSGGTEEQFNRLRAEENNLIAEMNAITQQERIEKGEASKNINQPENHIDNRSYGEVSSRNVKAFQFDHPELHPYFVEAAQSLKEQAEFAINTETHSYTDGTKFAASSNIKRAMQLNLSRQQIIKICDDIISNNGQENYAAAKKVELILNDMLSNGYMDASGSSVEANTAYIDAKEQINGAVTRDSLEYYLRDNQPLVDLGLETEESLITKWQEKKETG